MVLSNFASKFGFANYHLAPFLLTDGHIRPIAKGPPFGCPQVRFSSSGTTCRCYNWRFQRTQAVHEKRRRIRTSWRGYCAIMPGPFDAEWTLRSVTSVAWVSWKSEKWNYCGYRLSSAWWRCPSGSESNGFTQLYPTTPGKQIIAEWVYFSRPSLSSSIDLRQYSCTHRSK